MSQIRKINQGEFPSLLLEIPDAPTSLYMRGSLAPEKYYYLAVVGSRRMSRYAKDACEYLIRGLARQPISIVSGMALGVDTTAHHAALDAGLHTIAVLGSGIDDAVLYPRSNVPLAHDIIAAGGAILSEEEPGFRARPESFPKRNRIVTGMSHATLIIEAGERSGTLITAKLTVDYNRELLVLPHSIFSEGGAGGHIFMRLGAAPARSAKDILDALGLDDKTGGARPKNLTPEEQKVIDALASPLSRDELIRTLKLKTNEANALLLGMELKGFIQEFLGEIRKNI